MKIKNKFLSVIIVILILSMNSCYYDKEEILYPDLVHITPCDTSNVTYSNTISSVISGYCLSCHGATYKDTGGSYRFDNYDAVNTHLDLIITDITQDPNTSYNPMPKNSHKLKDCIIKQFVIWQQLGAPNN